MRKIFTFSVVLISLVMIFGCTNIKEGYLMTENAAFHPDSLVIPLHLDSIEYAGMIKNEAPFLSTSISGVSGTAPVRYKVTALHADNGYTDAIRDVSATLDGRIQIRYGYTLPAGTYWVDLEIYNDEHSTTKSRIFKIIVQGDGGDTD